MTPKDINFEEAETRVFANAAPFRNLIAFNRQPKRFDEQFHEHIAPFGNGEFFPRPSTVPPTAKAVKFNGLWFWGWDPE